MCWLGETWLPHCTQLLNTYGSEYIYIYYVNIIYTRYEF